MGAPNRCRWNNYTARRRPHAIHRCTMEGWKIPQPSIVTATQVVVAMAAAVKNERHQTTAHQKREQHAAGYCDVTVKRNCLAAETNPSGGREPDGQSQQSEQRHDD